MTGFAVWLLIFAAALAQAALAPLAPTYETRFALSPFEVGALYSATSLAIVAFSLPAGVLGQRVGTHRLTLVAGVLLALSALGQGFAPSYGLLLSSRAVFGIAYALLWSSGLALLPHDSRALAGAIPVSAAGFLVGPSLTGQLSQRVGLAVPFVVIGCLAGVGLLLLFGCHDEAGAVATRSSSLRETLRSARDSRLIGGAMVLMILTGVVYGTSSLLVPLELHRSGFSAGAIGLGFSGGGLMYITVTTIAGRHPVRMASRAAGGLVALLVAATLVLPSASGQSVVLVVYLLLLGGTVGTLQTIAYPLAGAGAEEVGLGRSAAFGLINAVWATASTLAPLAAGSLAHAAGYRLTFIPVCLFAAGCGLWLLGRKRVAVA